MYRQFFKLLLIDFKQIQMKSIIIFLLIQTFVSNVLEKTETNKKINFFKIKLYKFKKDKKTVKYTKGQSKTIKTINNKKGMTSSIIKYRINSVTSQSPQYPASNLTDQSSSMGWQSDYSPSYPQEINLQFFTPIRTKTLKLTFHQYKIPTLVEVFVRLTAKQNYRKLGYIVPNDNSQSSYEHKEIKTLYFEFPCNFIKLVFYQNYKNEMNLFEQVALEDLKIQGQAMTYNEIRNIDLTEEPSSADQSDVQGNRSNQQRLQLPQYNSNLMQTAGMQQLNKRFSEVFAYLQGHKSQAVEKQDFRLASHLKNVIQTFKANQSEIFSLQMQKRQALQQEDFDKCHRIKQQIQKQKEEFQYRVEEMYQNEENFMSEFSHSRILQDNEKVTERKQTQHQDKSMGEIKNIVSSTPQRQYQTSVGKNQSGRQGKKLSLNLNPQNFNNISGLGANNISTVSQSQSLGANKVVDHNDQIIPAVRNKLMGIKQQSENQFPSTTNPSVYDESKNYSSLGRRRGMKQQSPRALQNRSISPPKSPTRKIVTKAHTYVAVAESNMSLKSPIISYEQIQYQQVQLKQQTFSPSQEKQPISAQQDQRSQQVQQLLDRLKRLEVQPLDLKLRLKLQSHFAIIQQPYWQMIMHKSWSVKKEALEHIRDDVAIDSKQTYMAVMEFISFSINDPHPQVLLTTLSILRKLIQEGNSNNVKFTLPHMPYFIETIVNALLSLITSTNKQLSEQAYNLYLMLGIIGFLTIQYLVLKLIKDKQTTKVTPQYTVMKISLMISMIQKYQQTVKYSKEILLWAVDFLKDPNNKVRSQASYVILILVDVIGEDKVINAIKEKPEHMKAYQEMLNNSQLIQSSRLESLGEGSRYTDRNQSKLQDINLSVINNNKSLSKQRGALKNKSQLSQNPSSLSNQQHQQQKSSKRLKNPWTTNDEKSQKPRSNSKSRLDSQKNDDQLLQYSKESEFYGSSIKRQPTQGNYAQRRYSQSQLSENVLDKSEGEIKVMEENESDYWNDKKGKAMQQQLQDGENSHEQEYDHDQEEEEEEEDTEKCDYCFMDMNGMDQRQHLLTQCKVLVSCEECMGRVYIRETIYHLLNECTNQTHHQQCKKCGLVFNIDEINEHVGQGLCRLQRGEGWERCQFCGQDVMANDMKWVDHAYKCPNLPQPPELTQKQSQSAE